jgi:hypothetical protein
MITDKTEIAESCYNCDNFVDCPQPPEIVEQISWCCQLMDHGTDNITTDAAFNCIQTQMYKEEAAQCGGYERNNSCENI